MPKEDFCYTYYDGDAARDQAHMNRLQRGGYHDIISAQRKRGHLSINDIKVVLGNDFELCWETIEWVLKKDDEDKYFIEWVDKSLDLSKKNAAKNKIKIDQYWADVKSGKLPKRKNGNTKPIPQYNHSISSEVPLEDVNVNEYDNVFNQERGQGETNDSFRPDKSLHGIELPDDDFNNTLVYLEYVCSHEFKDAELRNQWLAPPEIERQWKAFKIQYFNGQQQYDTWIDVVQHFRDWLKKAIKKTPLKNGKQFITKSSERSEQNDQLNNIYSKATAATIGNDG